MGFSSTGYIAAFGLDVPGYELTDVLPDVKTGRLSLYEGRPVGVWFKKQV